MSSDKIMDSAWRSYSEQVIPLDAPDIQRQECRRSFYAGAGALFGGVMKMLDPGEDPTLDDLAKMDALQTELDQFNADVMAGKA